MTYLTSLLLMSVIGHIDLFSPPLRILTYLFYLNPKSTPIHGNCTPSPPTLAVSVDGNLHAFPWPGDYLLILNNICA